MISSLFFDVQAQQPYSLHSKKEGILLSSSAALGISALVLRLALDKPILEDLNALNPAQVNTFDRRTISNYNNAAARNSDIAFYSITTITAASVIGTSLKTQEKRTNLLTNTVMFFEANLLNTSLTELTKNSVQRMRPYAYNSAVSLPQKLTHDTKRSFFSGHTSVVATNAFLSAHLLSNYLQLENKWLVWVPTAIIPAYTGFERVRAGKHFISDVVVGYAVGMSCGLLIPQIHKSKDNFTLNASYHSDATLIGFSYRF